MLLETPSRVREDLFCALKVRRERTTLSLSACLTPSVTCGCLKASLCMGGPQPGVRLR